MRKNVFGRQLKRDMNERKALFKALCSSLIMHERIKTTEEKAKSIRPQLEKLVTKANRTPDTLHAYSLLQPYLHKDAVKKLMTDIAPRFKERPGGYTRIIKIGRRFSDDASLVYIEWVEKKPAVQATYLKDKEDKKTKVKKQPKKVKKEVVEKEVKANKTSTKSKGKIEKKETKK